MKTVVAGVKCVLLDIEGTICEISFVKEVLFPYALKSLLTILATKWDDADFVSFKQDFPEDAQKSPEAFRSHVEDLTKRDVKIAYLKNLQGYLWQTGYETGAYATPLFPDVAAKLKQWKEEGFDLAIYSSGSVFAQKLLFGHVKMGGVVAGRKRTRDADENGDDPAIKKVRTSEGGTVEEGSKTIAREEDGGKKTDVRPVDDVNEDNAEIDFEIEDLQHLIKDWFDTTNAGLKTESKSYAKIAKELDVNLNEILFLSDNVKEVDAAIDAGMLSLLVDRPGNAPVLQNDRDRLTVLTSLNELELMVDEENGRGEATSKKEEVGSSSPKGDV